VSTTSAPGGWIWESATAATSGRRRLRRGEERSVSYFTEGIELMKAAWSDRPTVTFHGGTRQLPS